MAIVIKLNHAYFLYRDYWIKDILVEKRCAAVIENNYSTSNYVKINCELKFSSVDVIFIEKSGSLIHNLEILFLKIL